jgi:hypothetical protein
MSFEYVLSGMGHTCGFKYNHLPEVQALYQKFFGAKSNNVEVSALYNAYAEKRLGRHHAHNFQAAQALFGLGWTTDGTIWQTY